MAEYTLADYKDVVKSWLNIDRVSDNDLYTDADILRYLNMAQRKFALAVGSGFFRTGALVDATAAAIDYPTGALAELNASLVSGTNQRIPLQVCNEMVMDQDNPSWRVQAAQSRPTHLVGCSTASGLTLKLYPTLSATITNVLYLSYLIDPTDMAADADTSGVMKQFPELQSVALPAYAMRFIMMLESGEADDQSSKYYMLWKEAVADAREHWHRAFLGNTSYGGR